MGCDVQLPDGTEIVPKGLFCKTGVRSVLLPSSIREIQEKAFCDCKTLKNVGFPKDFKLAKIGAQAFMGTNIRTLNIPASLRIIESEAFVDCKQLKQLTVPQSLE